jgi:hypothetical protein
MHGSDAMHCINIIYLFSAHHIAMIFFGEPRSGELSLTQSYTVSVKNLAVELLRLISAAAGAATYEREGGGD